MSTQKQPRKPRVQYETVYRVRWSAGEHDYSYGLKWLAETLVDDLARLHVNAHIDEFKRVKP